MFYLIDKPANMTSRDVVDIFSKKMNIKKVGHSGTLDPFATGLLIIGTDKDTKYLSKFLDEKKTYTGKMLFGKTTDSLDIDGNVIEEKDVDIDFTKLSKVINEKFIGKIIQVPPIISAKKIDGKRAYDLARENKEVNLKPVKKIVFDFKIDKTNEKNLFKFEVTVSSGTYIRSLARDIGLVINSPAMLTELRRIKVGNVKVENSTPIDADPIKFKSFEASEILGLQKVSIEEKYMKMLLEGKRVNFEIYEIPDYKEIIFIDINDEKEVLAINEGKYTYKIVKRIK